MAPAPPRVQLAHGQEARAAACRHGVEGGTRGVVQRVGRPGEGCATWHAVHQQAVPVQHDGAVRAVRHGSRYGLNNLRYIFLPIV